MEPRTATHAEAVFLAKSLNVQTELVWQIIQGRRYTSYTELESTVHDAFLAHGRHGSLRQYQNAEAPQTP